MKTIKFLTFFLAFAGGLFFFNNESYAKLPADGIGGGTETKDCYDKFQISNQDHVRFCGDCRVKSGHSPAHFNQCTY